MRAARSILKCLDEQLLLNADLFHLPILHECIRNFSKSILNRLLIRHERKFLFCLCKLHIRLEPASGEDRLRYLRHESPRATWSSKQTRQLITLKSEQSRQTDPRKVRSLRSRNERALRRKTLFSGSDVRSPF